MKRRDFLNYAVRSAAGLYLADDALELLLEPRRQLWPGAEFAPSPGRWIDNDPLSLYLDARLMLGHDMEEAERLAERVRADMGLPPTPKLPQGFGVADQLEETTGRLLLPSMFDGGRLTIDCFNEKGEPE